MDRISEIVQDFAQRVKLYVIVVTQADETRKMSRALAAVAALLTNDDTELDLAENATVTKAELTTRVKELDATVQNATAEDKHALAKLANEVQVFADTGLIPDEAVAVAQDAMKLWQSVGGRSFPKAPSLRAAS